MCSVFYKKVDNSPVSRSLCSTFNKVIILLRNIKFTIAILRSKEALERKTVECNLAMIQNITHFSASWHSWRHLHSGKNKKIVLHQVPKRSLKIQCCRCNRHFDCHPQQKCYCIWSSTWQLFNNIWHYTTIIFVSLYTFKDRFDRNLVTITKPKLRVSGKNPLKAFVRWHP